MDKSAEFYFREELLAHGKAPRNVGTIKNATLRQKGANPLCGDEIEIFANLENAKLTDVKFQGSGCYISQAAASLLTEEIKGKKVNAILKITEADVTKLLGGTVTPARKKCALLALWTIQTGIKNYLNVNKKKDAKKR